MRRLAQLCGMVMLLVVSSCGSEPLVGPTPQNPNPPLAQDPDPDPGTPSPPLPEPPPPTPAPAPTAVLVGAGDIGVCGVEGAARTATLLDQVEGIVFTAGDNAYPAGARSDFLDCFDPFWGRHKSRTRPAPGNHDYATSGASGYFDYFGPNAGPAGRGYYSFIAGAWLVLSLNSNVASGPGSAQLAWLREELASHPVQCAAAIWHHPLVSSGPHGNDPRMREIWRTLTEFNADIVVTGHDHIYERFAPLDADGFPSANGIREFVAGTGGAEPYEFGPLKPGSEAHGAVWGVLKLTLRPDAYEWEFVPVAGQSYRDQGTQACR